MSFGENQLKKFGWTEGQGLGREENGISSAIKPKLKFDKSGIGHNQANEFTFHWWDHVYNKTAQNLSVNKSKEGHIRICKDEDVKISTKKPKSNKKNNSYGLFVKGTTLRGSEEIGDSDASDDNEDGNATPEVSKELINTFSDAELFKLCGGLTAHKGARHGLTMSAKLARLEQQDKTFFSQQNTLDEESTKKSKKHKSKKRKLKKLMEEETASQEMNCENSVIPEAILDSDEVRKKKKKKKKSKREDKEAESDSILEESKKIVDSEECFHEHVLHKPKKRKKKKCDL